MKSFLGQADESLHVESVASPEEALRLLRSETYDCIVSDYQMPSTNGIELARRIRETSDIPFIIYTGPGSEEVAEAAFTVGIDDYIRKESGLSHFQVLAKRIRSVVEERKAVEELIQSEERYRTLLEHLPDPVTVRIGDRRVYATMRAAELLGYDDTSELLAANIMEFVATDDWPIIVDRMKRREAGEELPSLYEIKTRKTDGSTIYLEIHTAPIDYQGTPALLNSMRDVTARKRMEEALRRSEKQYRTLLEEGMDSVAIVVDSEYVYVNKAFVEMLGYSVSEMVGMRTSEIVDPRDAGLLAEIIERRKKGEKQRIYYEIRARKKDGSLIWMAISSISAEFEGKRATISNSRDITERKKMEEVLEERNWALGKRVKELECLYGIRQLVEQPGISLDRIFRDAVKLVPPAWQHPDVTCARVTVGDDVFETENFRETEWRQSSDVVVNGVKEGVLDVFYLEEMPEFDEGPFLVEERSLINEISGRLGIIIERKRMEEALKASENKFRQLFENEPGYCYMISPEGKILDINESALETLGYEKSEVLGKPFLTTIYSSSSREKAKRLFEKWRETGELRDEELMIITRGGEERPVLLSVSAVKDAEGCLLSTVSVQRDITERKRMEEELKRAEERWRSKEH